MDIYAAAYLLAGALLLSVEIYCVVTRNKQTVSHKLVRWIKNGNIARRLVVILFLAWLLYHLGFEYFGGSS